MLLKSTNEMNRLNIILRIPDTSPAIFRSSHTAIQIPHTHRRSLNAHKEMAR